MKIIGEHLTNFQHDTGKKPKEICAAMNISKSNYYKIREDGTSSIESFILWTLADFCRHFQVALYSLKPA